MTDTTCFLSLEEEKPLAIWLGTCSDGEYIDLDEFLNESKVDMSKRQAGRYAERLQQFVYELEEYLET